jgi:phage shock protein E
MKKFILLLFMLAAALTSSAQDTIKGSGKTSEQLIQEFQKGKAYLIDVRTPEEYQAGHLDYSKNINIKSGDFKQQISKLDKNKPVYLYCRSGNRSGQAADSLGTLGFKTYYNIGGFEQLKAAGLPAAK